MMDEIWVKLAEIADENNGIIKTSMVEEKGISRVVLTKYVNQGKIIKIKKGLYLLSNDFVDEYYLIQVQCSKAIFSHRSSAYLLGLSDRTPHNLDLTVPQGTNVSRFKKSFHDVTFHYVQNDLHKLGLIKIKSPQGADILCYDAERCVCDLIRNKDKTDIQVYSQVIRTYFDSNVDKRKVLNYSKLLKVENEVRLYMEIL